MGFLYVPAEKDDMRSESHPWVETEIHFLRPPSWIELLFPFGYNVFTFNGNLQAAIKEDVQASLSDIRWGCLRAEQLPEGSSQPSTRTASSSELCQVRMLSGSGRLKLGLSWRGDILGFSGSGLLTVLGRRTARQEHREGERGEKRHFDIHSLNWELISWAWWCQSEFA